MNDVGLLCNHDISRGDEEVTSDLFKLLLHLQRVAITHHRTSFIWSTSFLVSSPKPFKVQMIFPKKTYLPDCTTTPAPSHVNKRHVLDPLQRFHSSTINSTGRMLGPEVEPLGRIVLKFGLAIAFMFGVTNWVDYGGYWYVVSLLLKVI
ncbi:hypothetical protein PHJA_000633800 [Phtheirospermum japonicum]|uniref:Uncharacterized protein n=1 Tax=Phtheirospermum japonicum TaxID=374723 RepID=A0A830BB38_9LAMI|nr:hypothetical protein PHJA_000633800 [Phtheirospermum japonicum]